MLIKEDFKSPITDEERWNKRALSFNKRYLKEKSSLPHWVTNYLFYSKDLFQSQILDVGGGTGRYALDFARKAKEVFLTDVSINMIDLAKENQKAVGLNNMKYIHMDWQEDGLEDFGLYKNFELVFASMCPAVRSHQGINKMIKASKKWCSIHQFICLEDTFSTYLWNKYQIKRLNDPHQDKETVINTVNYLWSKNYTPEIHYFEEITESEITKNELAESVSSKYEDLNENALNIEEILEKITVDGVIKNKARKKTALITWNVE